MNALRPLHLDWRQLQRSWDVQQEHYLPDREERFAALLDVVEAVGGREPRVLDLAGGTGSISLRLLERLPAASSVIVDVDPVLLAIAGATFDGDGRVRVVTADLSGPTWVDRLPEGRFQAVVTATALHWLTEERVAGVYREAAALVAPGGVVANADHMPDPGLPGLLADLRGARPEGRGPDWEAWWEETARVPELADAFEARGHFAGDHTQSAPGSDWHVAALRAAGCAEAGLVWRRGDDALAVGRVVTTSGEAA